MCGKINIPLSYMAVVGWIRLWMICNELQIFFLGNRESYYIHFENLNVVKITLSSYALMSLPWCWSTISIESKLICCIWLGISKVFGSIVQMYWINKFILLGFWTLLHSDFNNWIGPNLICCTWIFSFLKDGGTAK